MVRFSIITIFPEIIKSYAQASILGRGQKAGAVQIEAINLRDFTTDAHKTVDDTPYGGGPGMVLKAQPIFKAVESLVPTENRPRNTQVILLDPRGQQFTQTTARDFSKLQHLILICGRYEGVDERVRQHLVDRSISIGPYVLSGGELAALAVTEATARLIPGVLGKEESLLEESFSGEGGSAASTVKLEYPQYTKPADFRGYKVPDVLLSGDHAAIAEWRRQNSTGV